ncbi:hypothetical protein [Okeania sp. SIO2B3]|uniref:hypothetical protein n=1 Tax=Okeania sp. SIO2B3 TaxID=2607784 RepID=UPI0013BFAB8A|nr:hypothetical protein [Okeania sp. SIO2B3]NET40911.1 hypothetical protein [Okeania sp. SIO2B3]
MVIDSRRKKEEGRRKKEEERIRKKRENFNMRLDISLAFTQTIPTDMILLGIIYLFNPRNIS